MHLVQRHECYNYYINAKHTIISMAIFIVIIERNSSEKNKQKTAESPLPANLSWVFTVGLAIFAIPSLVF